MLLQPSFSLGLTQEDQGDEDQTSQPADANTENHTDVLGELPVINPDTQTDVPILIRKSSRVKTASKLLTGVYQCDKLTLNLSRQPGTNVFNHDDNIDYPSKFSKLVDSLKTNQ